jgi:hypothetical protein
MLNGRVVQGVPVKVQRSRRLFLRITALTGVLSACLGAAACSGPTQVRLVLRVEEEKFRPDHVLVIWGTPGGKPRVARIPRDGSLNATGPEIASALITFDNEKPGDRHFIVRGQRNDESLISGANTVLAWKGGKEATLTVVLGCYEDPELGLPAGCPADEPDAGSPDTGTPIETGPPVNGGDDAAPVLDTRGSTADVPPDLGGDRPRG